MKFNDYKYVRPNMEEIKNEFEECIKKIENANSVQEISKAYDHINVTRKHFSSMSSLASIRNSINTTDKFYEEEIEYLNTETPNYQALENKLSLALYNSKFKKELEKKYGRQLFSLIECGLKTFDESIIPDLQEENRLITEYSKLSASAQIEFDGKINNLSQMTPYAKSKNRETRKKAEEAIMNFFSKNEEKYDVIYDRLVHVRTSIAQKLGYKNFIPLGYLRMYRTDYDATMVSNYRKQISENVIPLVNKIVDEQSKRLKIDSMKSYDLNIEYTDGNATPKGNEDYLVNCALNMYKKISNETGEFFQFMIDHELLDLVAKHGKQGGGYCTFIPDFESPFIFSNFNGTSGDVDVLTHEAGHAFQVYTSRNNIIDYQWPTYEACEIHSMSMEFFAYPYIENFFKEDTNKYLASHLAGTITFLPYGITVDEFQHCIYENPNMTPEERKKTWREIEKKYMPYKVYENDMLERGCYWYRQSHIFSAPFYYIDYTLAQICAQQFFIKDQENHEKAWNDYYNLCKQGGNRSFFELLKVANLRNPFEEGTVKYVMDHIEKTLDKFLQKIK